jgi:hypothetical protein
MIGDNGLVIVAFNNYHTMLGSAVRLPMERGKAIAPQNDFRR